MAGSIRTAAAASTAAAAEAEAPVHQHTAGCLIELTLIEPIYISKYRH